MDIMSIISPSVPRIIILYHFITAVMATRLICFFRKSSSLVEKKGAILVITLDAYLDILKGI